MLTTGVSCALGAAVYLFKSQQIYTFTTQKVINCILFYYSSVEERDQWMKALSDAIEENTQRRNTFETVKAGNQVIYSYHVNLQMKAFK